MANTYHLIFTTFFLFFGSLQLGGFRSTMAALNDEVREERTRFNPKDRELVDYLYKKVNDIEVPYNYPVYCMDVYGELTWRTIFELSADEDTFYFYTPLKQKSARDRRIIRVASDGRWKNQQRPKPIYDDDGTTLIGSKGNFSFIPNDSSEARRGKWVMHEYRLEGRYAHNLDSNWHGLCRIREKGRRASNAADANGIPADDGRPEDEDMSPSTERLISDLIVSPQ